MGAKGKRGRRTFDDPDRTARARIRDAAIERFASVGVSAANLKDIAADAGVSTPLVVHHFGSKDGLRAACDDHVAAVIRKQKHEAMQAGKSLDPFQAVREAYGDTPVLRYLAKTLADGSPRVDELIDEMLEDSLGYMAEGVENGILKPAENPRERAVVLILWTLGALVLHDQAKRLLGIDPTSDRIEDTIEWARVNGDVLAGSVIDEDYYESNRIAFRQHTEKQEPT